MSYLSRAKSAKKMLRPEKVLNEVAQGGPVIPGLTPAQDQKPGDNMGQGFQAKNPKVALEVKAKKTSDKPTKPTKPLPNRVSKSRKTKVVAKAKLSTHQDKKKKSSDKATKDGVSKAGKNGPGPLKTLNDELGGYGPEYEAEAIMDSKLVKGKLHYLVKWVGWPESSNTWEPEANLHNAGDLIAAFDVKYPDKP